jgi:hypothetical protein
MKSFPEIGAKARHGRDGIRAVARRRVVAVAGVVELYWLAPSE